MRVAANCFFYLKKLLEADMIGTANFSISVTAKFIYSTFLRRWTSKYSCATLSWRRKSWYILYYVFVYILLIITEGEIQYKTVKKVDTFSVEGSYFFWTGSQDIWPCFPPDWPRGVERKLGHFTLFFCRASHVEGQEVMSCNFVFLPSWPLGRG